MDPRIVDHVLGKDLGVHNLFLAPPDAIELARRTRQDAVTVIGGPCPDHASICTYEDIERWEPDPPPVFRENLEAYSKALQGTRIGLNAVFWGPFFTAYLAVGPTPIQDFLVKSCEAPDFIEAVMERILDENLKCMEAVLDLPIDLIEVADDTCDANGFMCAPELMERIWVPRVTRLVALAKQKGVPIHWHCCGRVEPLLPLLVDWGVNAVTPIQPKCNDIYALKEEYAGRLSFRGNLCIEGVLAFGSPDEVRAAAREHIERLAYDGGYVLASSHSIVDAIPPENFFAMIDTACEYGVF